ncbi:hypothetical protein [Kribbella sp. NPDC051770]|uniref:hypothetical protein n=1 Tax=Kribbella sp. NPDC051770 TaxID=3155413 RepID=UPI00343A778D
MFTVKVKPDGADEYSVTIEARDTLTWEKTTKGNKTFLEFMSNMDMQSLYKMAYIASWRQGLWSGTQKEFEETTDVVFEAEDEDPDPTLPGPSTGSSSDSPSKQASPRASGRKKANGQ